VLATALRKGISPNSTWTSKRQVIKVPNSSEKFTVNNYDQNYSGISTLARATTFSDNSVYAQVGIKTGTKPIARTTKRMGIRTPVSSNYAITLGGLRHGVTPLDLAHAYETFATGGLQVTGSLGAPNRGPVGIRRVTLRHKRNEVRARNDPRRRRVLSKAVAAETTRLLQSVIKVGTAQVAQLPNVPAWGKTGTTENYGDAWFVGATGKLTVAVWVGYPNELRPMRTEYRGQPVAGGTFPAQIWHDFMLSVLEADKKRLEKECASEQDTLKPDEMPSKHCLEAGLATAPTDTTPVPATSAPSTTTPPAPTRTTPGDDGETAPDQAPADAADDTPPAGDTPATPQAPAPEAAPAPAPAPVAPSSGGATPAPP